MAEFTPVTTQEEFDARIKDRIAREKETLAKKYADYDELKAKNSEYDATVKSLQEQIAGYDAKLKESEAKDAKIEELNGKVKGLEVSALKSKIANEIGLPYGMASRLFGDTEDAIKEDAQALLGIIGQQKPNLPPAAAHETSGNKTDARAGLKTMLENMKS